MRYSTIIDSKYIHISVSSTYVLRAYNMQKANMKKNIYSSAHLVHKLHSLK